LQQLHRYLENSCGVAMISRLLQMIGLFCRISSLLQVSFAKVTHNFQEPTSCSHPIVPALPWVTALHCIHDSLLHCINAYSTLRYGVATISKLLKIIGLFCKRALQKRPIFSKETCNFKEPTNRSHPIVPSVHCITENATATSREHCIHDYSVLHE